MTFTRADILETIANIRKEIEARHLSDAMNGSMIDGASRLEAEVEAYLAGMEGRLPRGWGHYTPVVVAAKESLRRAEEAVRLAEQKAYES